MNIIINFPFSFIKTNNINYKFNKIQLAFILKKKWDPIAAKYNPI